MAQLISITSEALQATIRRLLPSQQGFGEDLQATNVVTPIIDLTPTAEGSSVPSYLQQALAFGSQTSFDVAGSGVLLTDTPGFHRVFGSVVQFNSSSTGNTTLLNMFDGTTSKVIWAHESVAAIDQFTTAEIDVNIFVATGIQLFASTTAASTHFRGSIRQIADVNGVLINPAGFSPQ